jgi:hypothetical protein
MLVLNWSRSTAAPIPRPSPTIRPRARLSGIRGEIGEAGTIAVRVTDTVTGETLPSLGFSRSATSRGNSLPTAFAMSAARTGSVSETTMSSSTVSSGLLALTRDVSCSGVNGSRSSLITGSAISGLVTMSTYDFTRCCVNVLPWLSAEMPGSVRTETNSWV